ncbi:MAG: hypothetical protein IKU42_05085 [Oscillospiraceae bacterium]|nr:hypothetical protein [Oscillospiraceae bacterium]
MKVRNNFEKELYALFKNSSVEVKNTDGEIINGVWGIPVKMYIEKLKDTGLLPIYMRKFIRAVLIKLQHFIILYIDGVSDNEKIIL